MRYVWIFLVSLAQLGGCTAHFVSLPLETLHPARTIAAGTGDVRFALAGEDDIVIVSGPPDTWMPRTFTRIRGETSEPLVTLPEEWSWCGLGSEQLVAVGDGSWWYSRCAGGANQLSVRVIRSAAPSTTSTIAVARQPRRARGWLPMEGKDVAGVLLTTAEEGERKLRADLVSAGAATELGTFERNDSAVIGVQRWQAHRLDETRVALVSIELDSDRETSMVLLRVFENGNVTESRLPFARRRAYAAVASAFDRNGRLAVVVTTKSGVEAIVVDPHHPTAARARVISDAPPYSAAFGGPHVVAADSRFIAAWLRASDHIVQLCELDAETALPPVSVGGAAGGDWPLLALRRLSAGPEVLWSTASGIARRRLPEEPTGYLVASDLWTWLRAHLRQMGVA